MVENSNPILAITAEIESNHESGTDIGMFTIKSANRTITDAALFMMKLMNLKKKYGWSLLIIAHTPKRNLSSPITQNDLAGSKKLYNFFDSVFAIGKSVREIASLVGLSKSKVWRLLQTQTDEEAPETTQEP